MRNYTDSQLEDLARELTSHPESEVVEFKEAKSSFRVEDIGKYFSAISNEANLRGREEGWLLFGVDDAGRFVGSNFYSTGEDALTKVMKGIAAGTNNRITFHDIRVVRLDGHRIVMFQIPAAPKSVPTTWRGAAYSRSGDELRPLPLYEIDIMRAQAGEDWSKVTVPEATIEDLSKDAIAAARNSFLQDGPTRASVRDAASLSDEMFLEKAGLTLQGRITRTALLLLGDAHVAAFFDGYLPRITWTLYGADGYTVKAYQHFRPPFLLTIDELYARIRNAPYRRLAGRDTLLSEELTPYDPEVVKELIYNCLAHQDYRKMGRADVQEFDDSLVFTNAGSFIPGSIDAALRRGYKAPYYRNPFLCAAMGNLRMIDSNSMGIPAVFLRQKSRLLPMPTYQTDSEQQVRVTLYARSIDDKYVEILRNHPELDLLSAVALDRVQKNQRISEEQAETLARKGLLSGEYPDIALASGPQRFKTNDSAATKAESDKKTPAKADASSTLISAILAYLQKSGGAARSQIVAALAGSFPEETDTRARNRKVSNLLQRMKRDGLVQSGGAARGAIWSIASQEKTNVP